MSTIKQLCNNGEITEYLGDLLPNQYAERKVYFSNDLCNWLDDISEYTPSQRSNTAPIELIYDIFNKMVSGNKMVGEYVHLRPQHEGIYEIKANPLRIFGWFIKKNIFIACFCDTKPKLKNKKYPSITVDNYVSKTINYRKNLNLDEPKFIKGGIGNVL